MRTTSFASTWCRSRSASACCLIASRLSSHALQRLAYPALAVVAVLLVAVLVPGLGIVRGGARRWIGLGALNVQPSELAKIVIVLYLARSIVRKGARARDLQCRHPAARHRRRRSAPG